MQCLISNCYHKMTRRGRIDRNWNSWSIGICPCCLIELIDLGSIIWDKRKTSTSGCRQYKDEPEPMPRIIAYRENVEKIKTKVKKTPWKYIKVNSDKSKVDRSIIF